MCFYNCTQIRSIPILKIHVACLASANKYMHAMLLEKQDLQVYKYLKIFLPKLQVIIQSSTSILDNQGAEICITWHQFIEHIWVVCTWHRNHMISLLYLDLWWGRWGGLVPKPTTKLLPVSPRAYPICDLAHCLYWSGCTPTSAANNAINAMLAIEKLILLKICLMQ